MAGRNNFLEHFRKVQQRLHQLGGCEAKIKKKECKCFTWRDGTIEDMAISLLRTEMRRRSTTPETTEVGWTEKTSVIDELEQQFVTLPPVHRWKDRRPRENRNRNKDTTDKLCLSKEVNQQNITRSVEFFFYACDEAPDDLVQFVQFLLQIEGAYSK